MRALSLLLALSTAFATPLTAAEDSGFADACAKLEAGEFEAARDALQAIVASGRVAPELFFQLGNAHYRLDDVGRAALAYRRALYLEPGHRESAQNLEFLKRKGGMVDAAEPGGWRFARSVPAAWLSSGMTAGIWLSGFAAAGLIALRRKPRWLTLALASTALLGLGSAGSAGLLASQKRAALPAEASAVVISTEVVARSAPAEAAAEVFALPPGSAVIVAAERGPWSYVDLPGDLRGWVRSESIEALWPYEPPPGG